MPYRKKMIKDLLVAGLMIVLLYALIQINLNLSPTAMALRSPIETIISRMFTDNPANETLQIGSYPTISPDSTGAVHFVGEVVNKGNEPARSVQIIATFYDSQNRVIGTKSAFPTPDTIVPGQAAPFDLITGIDDTIQIRYIDHVKFHLDWRDSNHPF
jgi:hypothetical protein